MIKRMIKRIIIFLVAVFINLVWFSVIQNVELKIEYNVKHEKIKKCFSKHLPGKHKEAIINNVIDLVKEDEAIHNINLRVLLIAMAKVESSGNPMAVSKKGALGVWQVMWGEASYRGYHPIQMYLIGENLVVAKDILYYKSSRVNDGWRAVRYYCGTGVEAKVYEKNVQQVYKAITDDLRRDV